MNQYFTERVVILLLAAIASIGYFSLQRPQFLYNRSSGSSILSRKNKFISTTMVLSNLLYAINLGEADASAEECVATASSSIYKAPIHIQDVSIAEAITVEGVQVPGHRMVDGIPLLRNGHGLRSLTYFGIGIRIYVASMYTTKPLLSADQALGDETGPVQIDFTFLRYVRQGQVVSAWTQQLDHSVTLKEYEGYEEDRKKFIELASGGPIENQGTQTVVMVGHETRIIDQGKLKGVIHGKKFQKAFLSMWFGSMAVAEDLKASLLRGDEHQREQVGQKVQNELQQTLVKA